MNETYWSDKELEAAMDQNFKPRYDAWGSGPARYTLEEVIEKYDVETKETVQSQVLPKEYNDQKIIMRECIKELFLNNEFDRFSIKTCEQIAKEYTIYQFDYLKEERIRQERLKEQEREKQKKIDEWNDAIEWARQNGAKIRRGKVTKDLCKYRIYAAGLMGQFSERYPQFAFTKNDVEASVRRLKERDEEFADRKKHSEYKKLSAKIDAEFDDKYPM